MFPAFGNTEKAPRKLVAVGNLLGFYLPEFFPKTSGSNYQTTRLLKPLEAHRKDYSLFSGLDHGVKGGHFCSTFIPYRSTLYGRQSVVPR